MAKALSACPVKALPDTFFAEHVMEDALVGRETTHDLFKALDKEVAWERPTMLGRKISRYSATQGTIDDGRVPIYRYPVDELLPVTEFTPTVARIRDRLEDVLGPGLGLNHVLVQLYRDGEDHITPHADKTLDIARDSCVFNYSLGASRQMVFGKKVPWGQNDREDAKIWLVDDSALVLGPQTNREFVHSIPKRRGRLVGERISLTFRNIATFLSGDGTRLLGQGAGPTGEMLLDDSIESRKALIYSFSLDNKCADFDWAKHYGLGSGHTFRVV